MDRTVSVSLMAIVIDSLNIYNFIFCFNFLRKLKMYEEQELTMQVFSEPDIAIAESDAIVSEFSMICVLCDGENVIKFII